MSLSIGKRYSLYTNYNTIINQKVEVVAILSYDECKKVSYDLSVLGINERIISVKDEDIKEAIGSDSIYHCRALVPNADGTYSEFLVWDSIINFNKTTTIGEDYTCELKLNLNETSSYTIQQILNTIQASVQSTYGDGVKLSFSEPQTDNNTKNNNDEISEENLETVKSIINSINMWQDTLIPAVEKMTNSGLSTVIENINTELLNISSNIAMVKHGL